MKILFGDLEANGLLEEATKVWCGVFKDKNTGEVFKFRPHQMKEMLEFLDTADVLIFHNGTFFDFPVLKKVYNWEFKGKKVDTLVLSRLLNPKRVSPPTCPNKIAPHSIEAWGYRVGRGKPEHEDWSVFSEEMLFRCSEDVEILELTYNALMKEAEGKKYRDAFLLTQELFVNLQKQEEYGWKVDVDYIHFCIRQLTRWIDLIDRATEKYLPTVVEVHEAKVKGEYNYIKKPFKKDGDYSSSVLSWHTTCGEGWNVNNVVGPFSRISFRKTNLNSNDEVKDFLLKEGWEPLEWNLDSEGNKRSPKFSKDDEFIGINNKLGKIISRRVQCRQRLSIIQGFLNVIRKDGAIPSVISNLAVTGRATHRNIVNIPHVGSFYGKQMRKIFSSRKGKVLVGVDSDGCQIRMLCARMGDDAYTKTVLEGDKDKGTDMHSVNMRNAGLTNRNTAKTFFYALIFGARDARLSKTLECSVAEAGKIREKFLNNLPALKDLIDKLTVEFRKTAKRRVNPWGKVEYYDGYIEGLDGRPIYIPNEHQILVYMLQSDEAIMMTKAYNEACKRLSAKYKWGEDYGIVGWMHDEINVECKEEIAEDVKKIVEDCIPYAANYYKIKCPHLGNGEIGKNWMEVH